MYSRYCKTKLDHTFAKSKEVMSKEFQILDKHIHNTLERFNLIFCIHKKSKPNAKYKGQNICNVPNKYRN